MKIGCKHTDAEVRFWMNVKSGPGCWEWQGHKTDFGYGRIRDQGRMIGAHRFSWKIHFGEIPDGLYVCHHCDNPACIRPSHLFIGTAKDNADDCCKKGRMFPIPRHLATPRRGSNHPQAKLTDDGVREIRRLRKEGVGVVAIARRVGISRSVVLKVLKGISRAHVQ